jgi:hypothetical protein
LVLAAPAMAGQVSMYFGGVHWDDPDGILSN